VSRVLEKGLGKILRELEGASFGLTEEQMEALEDHLRMLLKWNWRMNLTGLKGVEAIVRRHYAESLYLGQLLPPGGISVADVGSGAGFPGFPIAVLRPEARVALLESNARKAVFLREACRSAANVRVVEGRAEDCRERFDWLVARGVAWTQLAGLIPRLSRGVAVLVGEPSVQDLGKDVRISWADPVRVPWMRSGFAMLGVYRSADIAERST